MSTRCLLYVALDGWFSSLSGCPETCGLDIYSSPFCGCLITYAVVQWGWGLIEESNNAYFQLIMVIYLRHLSK